MKDNSKNICNEKVFEQVFRLHAKNLKRFIYSKTRDENLAEDIIQDCFVKIWQDCDKVIFDTVKSYLYTISNNMFLNNVRHNKVVQSHQKEFVNDSTNESPEFLMLEEEFLVKLEKAIANLSEKQREVFLLNRMEKIKYKDIAIKLGISQKAVEKRMHEALLVLREKVGKV